MPHEMSTGKGRQDHKAENQQMRGSEVALVLAAATLPGAHAFASGGTLPIASVARPGQCMHATALHGLRMQDTKPDRSKGAAAGGVQRRAVLGGVIGAAAWGLTRFEPSSTTPVTAFAVLVRRWSRIRVEIRGGFVTPQGAGRNTAHSHATCHQAQLLTLCVSYSAHRLKRSRWTR